MEAKSSCGILWAGRHGAMAVLRMLWTCHTHAASHFLRTSRCQDQRLPQSLVHWVLGHPLPQDALLEHAGCPVTSPSYEDLPYSHLTLSLVLGLAIAKEVTHRDYECRKVG